MILHIATKEIYHNLTTLRFALMVILLPVLFMMNALIYSFGGSGYMMQINDYNRRVTENRNHIIEYADQSLAELALIGPGEMPKRPSRLTFCAGGVNEVVSHSVKMKSDGTISRGSGVKDEDYKWRIPLKLEYKVESAGSTPTRRVKINWVFIGILMSFFAILFTFDAIAEERARGTLSLMMSNTVSRGQVLLGKYLGAFVTLMVPLIISILMNLLIILLSRNIPFGPNEWLRILGMVGLFALLVSIFIFLGLFFSSRVSNAITSLVWLLLTWVFLAFVFPSLLGTFVGNLNPIPSVDEISMRRRAQLDQIDDEWKGDTDDAWKKDVTDDAWREGVNKLKKAPSIEYPSRTRTWAEYFTAIGDTEKQIADQHIDQQLRQVQLARDLTQISPIATFQYAMEGLANTSIVGYMDFVKQARRYRETFIDFVKTEDQGDPESLHIYPVREGLSQKPVDPDAVPVFEERISYRGVLTQVGLLVLFNLLFFILAQVSFLMSEIK